MSYLGIPRLIFAGKFQADPSTVNNDPEHFNAAKFRSNYQLPGAGASNGWWNPRGTGAWRFQDCKVTRVLYGNGTSCDDPNVDPLVGQSVNGAEARVEGKLVDLDSEQQMVSEIWGFRVVIGSVLKGFGLGGDFLVSPFADIWTRYPQGQPDSFFGAFYQSVLEGVQWAGVEKSPSLKELLAQGSFKGALSIKFNVDGFDDDASSPTFTFGRVVGSIGLYVPGEPKRFVAGRRLAPAAQTVNTAYAQLQGNVLALDLGNSLPTQSVGGPLVNQGPLYAALLPPAPEKPVLLGEIPYQEPGWYEKTAGVVSLPLSPDQVKQAASMPLGIVQSTQLPYQAPLLSELPQWVRADEYVFRLNPGDSATTTLYAFQYGAPLSGQQLSVNFDASAMVSQTVQGPIPGPEDVGEPTQVLQLSPSALVTGGDGTAVLTLKAGDPGRPRQYIDGQVYGITYGLGSTPPPWGSVQNPSDILNLLVWSGYKVPDKPDWMRDVRPIFQQYADLYPVMKPIVDLADFASVLSRRRLLQNVFSTPVTDPNYMPVTRDLSANKRTLLLKWLAEPRYMSLDSVPDLHMALQQAIELEHATIPAYLCALYSLKPGTNQEVASRLRSIVTEEMLHMALVSNLLVSLGGSPRIGHPGFVPNYPGPLPGGLRANLTVRLRKCSIAQIRDVFLSIEEPEKTEEPVRGHVDPRDPTQVHAFTIGWFYDEITRALERLSAEGKICFGHEERQLSEKWFGSRGRLYVIRSLADAQRAISEIKRQGEGTSAQVPVDGQHELAHYFKFAEIVEGRRIVKTHAGFAYQGEKIPFDESGVWPMMDDPNIALLPAGSRARLLAEQFARTYQTLLNALHRTFNGEPEAINQAIGVMYSLDLAAQELMQTPSGLPDGSTAGPSFQLPFPD
ncbi:MAG: ferritin-like protein [Myxococcaceae bacterium]|nr:ferritin-like protein [Myxococcaceae bacterium]